MKYKCNTINYMNTIHDEKITENLLDKNNNT